MDRITRFKAGGMMPVRVPEWKQWDEEPVIEGNTVTVMVGVWKRNGGEEALTACGFQTRDVAIRNGDEPLGGFGNERYLTIGSSSGPAVAAEETVINELSALAAEIPTRLYGGPDNSYMGAGSGKQILIMDKNRFACIRIEIPPDETFDRMVLSFRFLP